MFVFVRHGESLWNRTGRVQGNAAVPLTDKGRRQAAALAEYLTQNYDIDTMIVSSAQRAVETAEQLTSHGVVPSERATVDALEEKRQGIFQGLKRPYLQEQHPEYYRPWSEHDEAFLKNEPPSGESYLQFYNRVTDWWEQAKRPHDNSRTVCVVTHGGVLRYLFAAIEHDGPLIDVHRENRPLVQNCCVWVVKKTGGDYRIVSRDAPVVSVEE